MSKIVAYIDDERVVFDDIEDSHDDYGYKQIETNLGSYSLFDNGAEAGMEARRCWEDLAQDDPKEFAYIVGEENLAAWDLGQQASPGSIWVSSLEEWLDLWLKVPEEHWALYDHRERAFKCKHPDFSNYTVCYKNG